MGKSHIFTSVVFTEDHIMSKTVEETLNICGKSKESAGEN